MRKTSWLIVAIIGLLALSAAGCGSDDNGGNGEAQVGGEIANVELKEQNGSGESGTAELRAEGNRTIVEITLNGAPATAQPAHIHKGTCAKLDPAPAYPLEDVVDGRSTSTENVTLEDLKSGQYAINVHKSAADVQTYVACGDIGTGGGGSMGSGEGY